MLKTFDILMIITMAAAATVTYSIKHNAETKLEIVRKLEAKIKQEEETIDLLEADWALLTQPNRLSRLVEKFQAELQLKQTEPDQLVLPVELPKRRALLTPEEVADAEKVEEAPTMIGGIPIPVFANRSSDTIITGAVE